MRNATGISGQTSQVSEPPNMDCKPMAFMALMVLTFWFMLTYFSNSYFVVFLIFTNFILLFACCVSLSGYILRRYIDGRQEPSSLVEVSTISGSSYIPDYPPTYEDAVRNMSMVPCHVTVSQITPCVICVAHQQALKETTQTSSPQSNASPSNSNVDQTITTDPVSDNTTNEEEIESISSVIPSTSDTNVEESSQTNELIASEDNSSVSTNSETEVPLPIDTSPVLGEPPPLKTEEIITEETLKTKRKYRRLKRQSPLPPHKDTENSEIYICNTS